MISRRPVTAFILFAFLLSYGFGFAAQWLAGTNGWRSGGFVESHILLFFVVAGPAFAGAAVVRATGGRGAVRAWLVSDWRQTTPQWWWPLVPVATLVVTSLVYRVAGTAWSDLGWALSDGWAMLAAFYAVQILMVGLLEETGWRGWLLRHRLERSSPLGATLFVALVWGLWHLPKLLADWRFALIFAAAVLVNSILLTSCWARLRGGIALAAIAHGSFNAPLFFFSDRFGGALDLEAFGIATIVYASLALAFIALTRSWWTKRPASSA